MSLLPNIVWCEGGGQELPELASFKKAVTPRQKSLPGG